MSGLQILVVDDDPDIVDYLVSLLGDSGFQTRGAGDAAAAWALLGDSYRPDLIIVDVVMPGRSGLDLLVRLRQDPALGDIALVVLTGLDRFQEDGGKSYLRSFGTLRGPDAVLEKPIDPERLLAVVRKLQVRPG